MYPVPVRNVFRGVFPRHASGPCRGPHRRGRRRAGAVRSNGHPPAGAAGRCGPGLVAHLPQGLEAQRQGVCAAGSCGRGATGHPAVHAAPCRHAPGQSAHGGGAGAEHPVPAGAVPVPVAPAGADGIGLWAACQKLRAVFHRPAAKDGGGAGGVCRVYSGIPAVFRLRGQPAAPDQLLAAHPSGAVSGIPRPGPGL